MLMSLYCMHVKHLRVRRILSESGDAEVRQMSLRQVKVKCEVLSDFVQNTSNLHSP